MGTLVQEKLAYQSALIALLESLDLSTDGDGSGSGGIGEISDARMALVNLVKIKLDELIPQGEGVVYNLESEPNVSDPLDLYINGLLDEAAKNVLQTAPKHICPVKQSLESAVANATDNKIGFVKCPDDYLRLFAFRMTEWKRQVEDPITTNTPLYLEQSNKYTRGGTAKPVVAINQRYIVDAVYKVLEYYSVNTVHTINRFLYIPIMAAEDTPGNLWDSISWICAGKILQNINLAELSKLAFEQANLCYTNLR